MISCEELTNLISAYIDNELSEQERLTVEEHINECAECSAIMSLYREISLAVEDSLIPAPEALLSGLMSEIGGNKRTHRASALKTSSNLRFIQSKLIPLAACLAFILLLIPLFRTIGRNFGTNDSGSGSSMSQKDFSAGGETEAAVADGNVYDQAADAGGTSGAMAGSGGTNTSGEAMVSGSDGAGGAYADGSAGSAGAPELGGGNSADTSGGFADDDSVILTEELGLMPSQNSPGAAAPEAPGAPDKAPAPSASASEPILPEEPEEADAEMGTASQPGGAADNMRPSATPAPGTEATDNPERGKDDIATGESDSQFDINTVPDAVGGSGADSAQESPEESVLAPGDERPESEEVLASYYAIITIRGNPPLPEFLSGYAHTQIDDNTVHIIIPRDAALALIGSGISGTEVTYGDSSSGAALVILISGGA